MVNALDRFVSAQAGVYPTALAELRNGAKRTHWMWFIFPQIAGLGHSAMARRFAISGREEALAYAGHEVLGRRLRECSAALLAWHEKRDAASIMGTIDAMKLRSSMTLFETVSESPLFAAVLDAFFKGERDAATLIRL